MEFANKRAVVTGAGSGIGQAIAVELSARGATVLISDVDDGGMALHRRGVNGPTRRRRVSPPSRASRQTQGPCENLHASANLVRSRTARALENPGVSRPRTDGMGAAPHGGWPGMRCRVFLS